MLAGRLWARLWTLQTERAFSSKLLKKASRRATRPDERLLPTVALLGKPNVGKSTLFNRLVQRPDALVKDTPDGHVTRDYRKGLGKLGDLFFHVYDTPGLEPSPKNASINARATRLTASLLDTSDAAVLLVDARTGLTPSDHDSARWLRASYGRPIILAVNKAERTRKAGPGIQDAVSEATRLGLGEPVAISAETGEGMVELYHALQPGLDAKIKEKRQLLEQQAAEAGIEEGTDQRSDSTITLAIVGLPNAGKSTLMNQLLGRERSLTGPEAGLTRDAVRDAFTHGEHRVNIIDTSGWLDRGQLSKAAIGKDLAERAQLQTARSYNQAQIVVLVVDATHADGLATGLTRREVALATDVVQEGRALLVAVNKLDAVPSERRLQVEAKVESQLQRQLPQVRGAACLGISAATGEGCEAVKAAMVDAYTVWNQRIPTSRLNRWLIRTVERCEAEGSATQILRVRYLTQASTRPPSFVAFVSGGEEFPAASVRFIGNALRQEFGFDGVPLRINIRMRKSGRSGRRLPAGRRQAR